MGLAERLAGSDMAKSILRSTETDLFSTGRCRQPSQTIRGQYHGKKLVTEICIAGIWLCTARSVRSSQALLEKSSCMPRGYAASDEQRTIGKGLEMTPHPDNQKNPPKQSVSPKGATACHPYPIGDQL